MKPTAQSGAPTATQLFAVLILTLLALTPVALADNTSSNSSSNSSNGVHTRVDTIVTDDGGGQTIYVRRSVRSIRERDKYRYRAMRRWHRADDDD